MKDKIKEIQENLQNNPKFQEQMQKIKPKRTIWGFLGVILFFFVPEFLNYFYHNEINAWIINYAQNAPNKEMGDMLIWLSKKTFDGELSYINISLGFAFLFWLFKRD
jgi:CDP-diglyceride synthetase